MATVVRYCNGHRPSVGIRFLLAGIEHGFCFYSGQL
jgi:hypothetical protein